MFIGILDGASHMPIQRAPTCDRRINIDGPALRAMSRNQPWIMLRVLPTTDEQRFAAATPDSGDQRTLHVDAVWTTANPKLANQCAEAVSDLARQ
jgi:hypothetical protein